MAGQWTIKLGMQNAERLLLWPKCAVVWVQKPNFDFVCPFTLCYCAWLWNRLVLPSSNLSILLLLYSLFIYEYLFCVMNYESTCIYYENISLFLRFVLIPFILFLSFFFLCIHAYVNLHIYLYSILGLGQQLGFCKLYLYLLITLLLGICYSFNMLTFYDIYVFIHS